MTKNEFLTLFSNIENQIIEAIQTGAAWEIWLQVELYILLRLKDFQVAREVLYYDKKSDKTASLDLLVRDGTGFYAIELKVESARRTVRDILTNLNNDIVKLSDYKLELSNLSDANIPLTKWVVCIAYTPDKKSDLNYFSIELNKANVPNVYSSEYAEVGILGVLIVTVS